MEFKRIVVDNTSYDIPKLSNKGYSVGVRQWKEPVDNNHFVIQTVKTDFNKKLFAVPHTPLYIGKVFNIVKFGQYRGTRVLDLPIKFPGSSKYLIPYDLEQFDEVISKIVSFEHHINPNVSDYYFAYLTIDQSYVKENEYQRKPGCHCLGFQGFRHPIKQPSARSYIISTDDYSPIYYPQAFNVQDLTWHDNFFVEFDRQADQEVEISFDRYSIVVAGAHTVLREAPAKKSGCRIYFRLTFDRFMYDRLGNSHNPTFNYDWPMVNREIPKALNLKSKWYPGQLPTIKNRGLVSKVACQFETLTRLKTGD